VDTHTLMPEKKKNLKQTRPLDTYCFMIIPPPVHALSPTTITPAMTILATTPPLSPELSESTDTLSKTSSKQWKEHVSALKVALEKQREKNENPLS